MAKTTAKTLPSWRVVLLRKKAERVATVQARTAEEAIAAVIKECGIEPERAKRLAAVRVE